MKPLLASILVAATCLAANAQQAQSNAEEPDSTPAGQSEPGRNWQFEIAMYGWLSALSADTTVGNAQTTSVDASIGDVLDVLKFAGFAHAEAHNGRWGFFTDVAYAKLGKESEVKLKRGLLRPGIEVDATLTQTIVEAGLFRRFGNEDRAFDLLGGVRYFDFQTDVDLGPFNIDPGKDWIDPFIGGRYSQQLSERWKLTFRGDLGGFGAGSDITINASATLRYAITQNIDAGLGYRCLYVDYDKDRLEYESTTHGPVVGMAFTF